MKLSLLLLTVVALSAELSATEQAIEEATAVFASARGSVEELRTGVDTLGRATGQAAPPGPSQPAGQNLKTIHVCAQPSIGAFLRQ